MLEEDVKREFVEKYIKLWKSFGFNETIGRIYGELFFAEKPLTMEEIAKRTGYSVSTVCNAMSIIEQLMDVKKFKKPGSKRVYFQCEHNLLISLDKIVKKAWRSEVKYMLSMLREAEEKLSNEKTEKAKMYKEYISTMRKDYEMIDSFLEAVINFRKYNIKRLFKTEVKNDQIRSHKT